MIPYNITLLHKITPLPVYVCRYMHSFCSVACQSTYIMEMNYSTKPALLVLAILLLIISPAVEASPVSTSLSTAAGGFRPMEATAIGRKGDVDLWRRRLAPFQLCLLCKCCAGAATTDCASCATFLLWNRLPTS
ncbi:hypothetical protein DKX38_006817 [Salix brachista]|uniref:Uncharacterized protein n=1 Tax=Salix brachista TaxID=2182728 RepID=A0A5N5N2T7_9ROSI|nr:hypothetical protein DKX38_006817 [Salix brachista]